MLKTDPALPMQRMLPLLPMLRIEPALSMLKIEPALPMLRIDPALPMLRTLKILPMLPTLSKLPMPNKPARPPAPPPRDHSRFRPERLVLRTRTPLLRSPRLVTQLTGAAGYAQYVAVESLLPGALDRVSRPPALSSQAPWDTLSARRRNHLRGPTHRSPSCSAAAPHGRWSPRLVRCSRRRCAGPQSGCRALPSALGPTPPPRPA